VCASTNSFPDLCRYDKVRRDMGPPAQNTVKVIGKQWKKQLNAGLTVDNSKPAGVGHCEPKCLLSSAGDKHSYLLGEFCRLPIVDF
jgi:hypothetical protein